MPEREVVVRQQHLHILVILLNRLVFLLQAFAHPKGHRGNQSYLIINPYYNPTRLSHPDQHFKLGRLEGIIVKDMMDGIYWEFKYSYIRLLFFLLSQQNQLVMSFLDEIWQQLEEKKKKQVENKDLSFKEVHKGYRTIPVQELARREASHPNKNCNGRDLWKEKETTEIFTYMQNAKFTNCANNGFFTAFYKAYMEHGDLKIKPDEVWMMIMLWFTKYVDDNAQELRFAFVMHAGKKELVVQTDKNLYDWQPFMHGVIDKIKENTVKGVVEELECNFSSTGLFERIFSTALVMNTCKKYFDYTREGEGCGIVNVHMAGTLEDWVKLQKKLANLEHFDVNGQLKKYIRGLKPVLNQFTQTYKGNANLQFWNNLYFERENPNAHEYMPTKIINGWLIKFFTTRNDISEIQELENFSVDIKYVDIDTKQITHFNLNGGCKGYSCTDGYTYTPHYSFAVVIDEKKMKGLKKEIRQTQAINKHKERMTKKKVEGTPIANKKVVNIEFNNIKLDMPTMPTNPYELGFKKMQPKKELKNVLIGSQLMMPLSYAKRLEVKKEEKEETKQRRISTRK